MIKFIIHIVIGLLCFHSLGQKLNVKVSESQILIGQRTTITYSIDAVKADRIQFSPKSTELEARAVAENGSLSSDGTNFEIVDDFKDTFIVNQDDKKWIGQYVVTAWDSGLFLLPGPSVIINDSTLIFPDVNISCYLTDPVDGVDLYDIRENYAAVPSKPFSIIGFLKTHWWWIAILIAAVIGFTWYKRYKKRKKALEDAEEVNPISLKERTLIAIQALEDAKLWEQGRLKEHFVELSYILRSYLTSRYSISLLEKTTYETTLILTQKGLEKETVDVIIRILSQSDMVKFAKSEPDVVAILRVSTLAKQVVAETSPLDFDNAE